MTMSTFATRVNGAKPLLSWRAIATVCDFVVGGVFVIAAASKVGDNESSLFINDLIPALSGFSRGIVVAVIAVELVLGSLLMSGLCVSLSRVFAAILLICFTAVLLWARFSGVSTECGCMTIPMVQESQSTSLLRNALLLVLISVAVIVSPFHKELKS